MNLRNYSQNGGEDNNISLPSCPHCPGFLVSNWEISRPRRVLPAAIIMGYFDLGASCFLQWKLLHFVRIIKYPLDWSKGDNNFVVGALPWDVGILPTAASMSSVYTEWNDSRRKGWAKLQVTL